MSDTQEEVEEKTNILQTILEQMSAMRADQVARDARWTNKMDRVREDLAARSLDASSGAGGQGIESGSILPGRYDVALDAAVSAASVRDGLLHALGHVGDAPSPMVEVVLAARDKYENPPGVHCSSTGRRAAVVSPEGQLVDHMFGATGECPQGVQLYPPARFEAKDRVWITNTWMGRYFAVKQPSGRMVGPLAREGQLVGNTLLWTEMAVITGQLISVCLEQRPVGWKGLIKELHSIGQEYVLASYNQLREHADDQAYSYSNLGAASLFHEHQAVARTASTMGVGAQAHARAMQTAALAAHSKAFAARAARQRYGQFDDVDPSPSGGGRGAGGGRGNGGAGRGADRGPGDGGRGIKQEAGPGNAAPNGAGGRGDGPGRGA